MRVNYFFKLMVAAVLMLAATTVKANDIPVSGTDRDALVAALSSAENGDVLLISASIGIGGEQLTITKGVTLKGVGEGIEIKPAAGYTSRVLQLEPGDGNTLIFENLTFKDANNLGNDTGGEKDGGLGRTANGILEFNNCKFINNYSDDRGGVFDMYGGNATFTDCQFTGNSANGRGGAIFTRGDATKATFVNCKFTGNHTNTGGGGVFYLQNKSEQKIYNSILSENYAGAVVDETDWTKNTGGGGAVFKTDGEGVLYVENSTIVKNYTLNEHGGVLFADSKPTVTFVNTTIADNIMYRDANSMFFCTNALSLSLINVTYVGNNAYVAQEGDPAGKQGPNSGNSTGIRINNKDARVKIYNSILAGNLSRNGGLVPVDLFLQDGAANADNAAAIFEIKNSIIGNIKGLAKNALSVISGIETSKYDFYPETTDWQDSDNQTGIVWENGLTTLANGQAYYPLTIGSKAAKFGDPALLAAYITPLVDQLGKARTETNVSAGAVEFANTVELSLSDVLVEGGSPANTYDPATHTITFNSDWNGIAYWDVTGWDISAYDQVTVEFENAAGGYVRFSTDYVAGGWGPEVGENNPVSLTADLDLARIDSITRVHIGVNEAGSGRQVVLKRAYFSKKGVIDGLTYSIEELNFFENSSYDANTHIATYNGNWQRVGWNFEAQGGIDASEYNQVFLEFDASALPASGEGEHRGKIQFDVTYMDGTTLTAGGGGFQGGNEYRASDTIVWWNISKKDKIKLITLKSEVAGNITLKDAYFYTKPVDPVDLIITNISWTPVSPHVKDSVTFTATIKNTSAVDSPADTKHGVVFQINGTTVSWADGFMGPIPAGGEVTVSSRGENSTGALWVVGKEPQYTLRAWVNDQKDVVETDNDNNYLTDTIKVADLADLTITNVTWDSEHGDEPKAGDHVVFTASIANTGLVNTPTDVKHGVAFSVNGTVVSWSDDFRGPIIAAGARVRLEANGGPNGVAYWVMTGDSFTVTAEVNDQGEIAESDATNNTFTATYGNVAIGDVSTIKGNIYAENGQLHIIGYPSSASVNLYNVLGQKVASFKSISEDMKINLTGGAYVVQIQNNGKSITQKVLVK